MLITVMTPSGPRQIPQEQYERLTAQGHQLEVAPGSGGFAEQAQAIQQQAAQAQQGVQQETLQGRQAYVPGIGEAVGDPNAPGPGPALPPQAADLVDRAIRGTMEMSGAAGISAAAGETPPDTSQPLPGPIGDAARPAFQQRADARTALEQQVQSRGSANAIDDPNALDQEMTQEGPAGGDTGAYTVQYGGSLYAAVPGMTRDMLPPGVTENDFIELEDGTLLFGQRGTNALVESGDISPSNLARLTATQLRTPAPQGPQGPQGALNEIEVAVTERGQVDPGITQAMGLMDEKLAALQQAHSQGALDLNTLQAEGFGYLADTRQEISNQMSQADEEAGNEFRSRLQFVDQNLENLRRTRINPEGFFGEGGEGTARRFGAAIVTALGALASNLTGGPNTALEIIERRIQDNIGAQQANLQNQRQAVGMQQNALNQLQGRLRDERSARDAMYAMQWQMAINRLQSILTSARAPMMRAGADALIVGARLRQLQALASLQQNQFSATYNTTSRVRGPNIAGNVVAGLRQNQQAQFVQSDRAERFAANTADVDPQLVAEADANAALEREVLAAEAEARAPARPARASGGQRRPTPRLRQPAELPQGLVTGEGSRQDLMAANTLDQQHDSGVNDQPLPGGIDNTPTARRAFNRLPEAVQVAIRTQATDMFGYESRLRNVLDLIDQGVPANDPRMNAVIGQLATAYARAEQMGALSGPDMDLAELTVGPTSGMVRRARNILNEAIGHANQREELMATLHTSQNNWRAFLRGQRLSSAGTGRQRLQQQRELTERRRRANQQRQTELPFNMDPNALYERR